MPRWKTFEQFGWRWERKEIENYLIDPVVVQRSLGEQAPAEGEYQQALESARNEIAVYQAARAALSACRPRFRTSFLLRDKTGKEKHWSCGFPGKNIDRYTTNRHERVAMAPGMAGFKESLP